MTKNTNSTRFYSRKQEEHVANKLEGYVVVNSGAGLFNKGDVVINRASCLIECKTCLTDKNSFSIKKDWIEKNKEEANEMRLDNNALCFSFGPESKQYYIIDEKLMSFLINKLADEIE